MRAAALIATDDPLILDHLLRLAAVVAAEAEVVHDADQARAAWADPPLVLVGADLAAGLARGAVPRRPGVALVTSGDDVDVYRTAVEIGAQDVAVLPAAEPWLVDALAAAADPGGDTAVTVCVIGGRGGAGASTLCAVLGLTAMRRGLRTLLVDADPLGGGLDLALGRERAAGARWPELANLRGRLSGAALREALPGLDDAATGGELAVLAVQRGPDRQAGSGELDTPDEPDEPAPTPVIPASAIRAVLDAGRRGFDLVAVDLPRNLGEAGVEALRAADTTLLVVSAEVRSAVAADRVAGALRRHTADVRVIVRGPAPGGLTADAIAGALDLPLAGAVRSDRRLAEALERGEPLTALRRRRPLTDLCTRLIADLGVVA
jgi:secretion/DNA translocation related CpaE-like protein